MAEPVAYIRIEIHAAGRSPVVEAIEFDDRRAHREDEYMRRIATDGGGVLAGLLWRFIREE